MIRNDRGQTLVNKYVWVIETIHRAKKISFEDLNKKWINDEISLGERIPKRTFDNWKSAIADMFGLYIENEGKGDYRYYIMNDEDISHNGLGLRSWLYHTFCVSNALSNCQNIKDRILLEYIPSGQEFLQPIIEAMKGNKVINFTYYIYSRGEEFDFKVYPYCVKLFHQRWYMVAQPEYDKELVHIYSLDRILNIQTTDETFKMPKNWSAEEFFKDSFGIIVDSNVKPQKVKLKVSASQANYIRDLKLHASQKEIECNEEYSIFQYYLRPHYDFIQELLWNGGDVEVLEPLELRDEIARIIDSMWNKYQEK